MGLLVFLARSPKVPTLDGRNVNWQPSLLRSASIFPETGSYILTKSIGTNALTCLGSLESPDSSSFFLLSSDRQGFLPKRLGVPVVQGKIGHRAAPSVRSVLEYPLWLQGVPGRSPGAKCIVFVSNIPV